MNENGHRPHWNGQEITPENAKWIFDDIAEQKTQIEKTLVMLGGASITLHSHGIDPQNPPNLSDAEKEKIRQEISSLFAGE